MFLPRNLIIEVSEDYIHGKRERDDNGDVLFGLSFQDILVNGGSVGRIIMAIVFSKKIK